tara:strand:- start:281 stop:955 length:675 start_codon:yes stop_codon:yes gene_type:complete
MRVIPCFILARKNSKGIKNKNLTKIGKKSLLKKTIDYLKKTKLVSHIVVSTDDLRIAKISKNEKCYTIFPRPKKLSDDFSSSEAALKHALKIFENKISKIDIVAYVQLTEPFRPPGILDKCIRVLINNKKIDSCFAAFEQKKNFWVNSGKNLKRISPSEERYKPRQKKKSVFREDTGIALATRSKFIKIGERIGKKVKCIKYTNPKYSIDINSYDDLNFARKIR